MRTADAIGWLERRWVTGAGFMAAALLAVTPMLARALAPPAFLIFLCSPVYMLHQVEEHRGDRFRRFVNTVVFGGREAMTQAMCSSSMRRWYGG